VRRRAAVLLIVMLTAAGAAGFWVLRPQAQTPESDTACGGRECLWSVNLDQLYGHSGYRWHVAVPGESVQFGVPETDDRAMRIDCHDGRIAITGPTIADAPEGSPIRIRFANGDRRIGAVTMLGDGNNFTVEMAPADPLLTWLLGQERIAFDDGEGESSVPLAGGTDLIRGLIDACRA
jgi:hypothetical protein